MTSREPPTPARTDASPPRTWRRRAVRLWAVLVVLGILVSLPYAGDHVRAAAILARAAGVNAWFTRFYDAPITIASHPIGRVNARLYRPANVASAPGIVLVHGVQYMGIDDDRLDRLASELARGGFVVLTPEIASLAQYEVTRAAVDDIATAVNHLATQPFVSGSRVAILGASFAGGLALLAASEPALHARVSCVVSVGGHHSIEDVARDLVEAPREGVANDAHVYGLQVFVYAYASEFVPPDLAPLARDAIRTFLHGDLARAESLRQALPEEPRDFVGAVFRGDRNVLAPRFESILPRLRPRLAALSPAGHLAAMRDTPVVLIHGRNDAVIPASESIAAARELAPSPRVALVVTTAIDHVHRGRGGAREQWRVVHAFAEAIAAMRAD